MKSIFIKTALVVAAVAGILSGSLMAGAPKAGAAFNDCPTGVFCAWDGAWASGTRWQFPYSVYPRYLCWALDSDMGYKAWGAVYNRYGSNLEVYLYTSTSCGASFVGSIGNGSWFNTADYGLDNQIAAFASSN